MVMVTVCVYVCAHEHACVRVCLSVLGEGGGVWVPLCPPSCKKMGSLSFQGGEDLEAESNRKCSVWDKFPSQIL